MGFEKKPNRNRKDNRSRVRTSRKTDEVKQDNTPSTTRLNKYIAQSGVCSRREADELIKSGKIRVNNKVVTEMGFQIKEGDKVYHGKTLLSKEKLVYILLNKPKDFITTTDDPQERKTVMQLVSKACAERIYPVGRLDRNTTGILLLTNDGELSKKLTHPSHEVGKIYHGRVERIVDFGAFINSLPGKDGLLHISQIADERVETVTDYIQEGQTIDVVVLDVDQRGRIKLSMKEVPNYAQSA